LPPEMLCASPIIFQHTRPIMPDFEEPQAVTSSKENYTPSTDASSKPRTRRRSGGFKTEYAPPKTGIGEVDPVHALKEEKLSGRAKPQPEPQSERQQDKAHGRNGDRPERSRQRRSERAERTSKAQPSPETLAAIQRVEARLNERKAARDTRRGDSADSRPERSKKNSSSERKSAPRKPQSKGFFATILSFFGLGPKEPAKKKKDPAKPAANRSPANRPRSKDDGDRRRSGQNRRGSGNKGRRSENRSRENQS